MDLVCVWRRVLGQGMTAKNLSDSLITINKMKTKRNHGGLEPRAAGCHRHAGQKSPKSSAMS